MLLHKIKTELTRLDFLGLKPLEDSKLEKRFSFRKGYHTPRSARQHLWINGEYTKLPDNDPGGEHE